MPGPQRISITPNAFTGHDRKYLKHAVINYRFPFQTRQWARDRLSQEFLPVKERKGPIQSYYNYDILSNL